MYKPKEVRRGEIYNVDWGKGAGDHPALIIQNDIGNKESDSTIVAYITHTIKGYPVTVIFKDHESGLNHGGSIDLGKIMTIPKAMLKEKRGVLISKKMPEVNKAIATSLGLEQV
jgi:mRNA interferase MazF